MKITDAQIRQLRLAGKIDDALYRGAMLVIAQHGSLGRRVRRESRRRCAELLDQAKEHRC